MVTVAFCLSEMDWLLDLDLSNLEVMKATEELSVLQTQAVLMVRPTPTRTDA